MASDYLHLQMNQKIKEQMLDQVPSSIMAVDKDFKIIYLNQAGLKTLARSADNLIGHYCYEVIGSSHCNTKSCCMKKAIETGKVHSDRTEVPVGDGKITVEYYTVPLKDEDNQTIGGLEFAVDISRQVEYEKNLIEQSRTIQQLSTPTIKLWDGILVLPIVGVIDSLRAQNMMESMLNKIVETYSKVIILDIQGVAAVDTAVAQHLIKIAKATKLMGCVCILSGISPAVAQTIIQLGIDMESIRTKATLSDAFSEALDILSLKVTAK